MRICHSAPVPHRHTIQGGSAKAFLASLGTLLTFCPLPFILQIGNLANDGVKLTTSSSRGSRCSADAHDGLEEETKGGTLRYFSIISLLFLPHGDSLSSSLPSPRAIWTHGGPSSAFLHILMALSLLVPRLLLESRMIQSGLLPKGRWSARREGKGTATRHTGTGSVCSKCLLCVLFKGDPSGLFYFVFLPW